MFAFRCLRGYMPLSIGFDLLLLLLSDEIGYGMEYTTP